MKNQNEELKDDELQEANGGGINTGNTFRFRFGLRVTDGEAGENPIDNVNFPG